MTLSLLLYLTEIIHNIDLVFGVITTLVILSSFAGVFFWCATNDGYHDKGHAQAYQFLMYLLKKSWILIIVIFIQIFIPTKTTMYMMLGSKYLSDSNIPAQVSEILQIKLNDVLKKIKKENKDD